MESKCGKDATQNLRFFNVAESRYPNLNVFERSNR